MVENVGQRPGGKLDETASQPARAGRPALFESLVRYQAMILPIAGLAIAALAFLVLRRHVDEISFADVRHAFDALPASDIALAILFTAISFAGVAIYDVVAVETVAPGKIPLRIAAFAGAAGYAISNALGFGLLTGGALRYRIYAAQGVALADIGRIVGNSWIAIWFAFAVVIAMALMIDPRDLPWASALSPGVEIAIGAVVLAAIAGFVLWLSRGEHILSWRRLSVRLPNSRGAMLEIAAGLVDVIAAASALYVLLPETVTATPAAFALIYVLALIVGIASHAPGGLGAFEATIIAGLGLGNDASAIAGIFAYRMIYTLLPFLVAVVGMVVSELLRQRETVRKGALTTTRMLEPLVPPLSAGVTFLGGTLLLISSATPTLTDRLAILSDILPLPFVEVSHLTASVTGLAMLVVARGLARRLARGWAVAVALFGIGAVASLMKGLDWEEALVLASLCAVLIVFRKSFYRRPLATEFTLSWGWLASVATLVLACAWLGFFAYAHVQYSTDLFWQFAFDGDAPRFLRASVVAAALLTVLALSVAINRGSGETPAPEVPAIVRDTVSRSHDSAAALALLGDKHFLIDPEGTGFVMYARSGGSLIAMGEPIGDDEAVTRLAWAFRDLADRAAARTVFYEVGVARLPLFLDMGLIALKLGEVARVELANFSTEGAKAQNLRYALRRAGKENIRFEILSREAVPDMIGELRAVSNAWLEMKAGSEKGFSLGFFDDAYLANFDCAVLRQGDRIIAFANLWRSGDHEEMAVDLMRHLPEAPRYIMDALFTELMLAAKAEGYRWFNLGAAPLAGLSADRLASRWHRFGAFLYRRGANFYHFEGLKTFKEKFGPVWTPHYLICPPGLDTARALVDVTALISGGPLGVLRR